MKLTVTAVETFVSESTEYFKRFNVAKKKKIIVSRFLPDSEFGQVLLLLAISSEDFAPLKPEQKEIIKPIMQMVFRS